MLAPVPAPQSARCPISDLNISHKSLLITKFIYMKGMLIDAADLYAANVSGAVQDVKVAGGELSTTLALTSPRPVRVSSETSSGLTAWSPNASEQKHKTGAPGQWTVQTAASADEKFMKIAA